MQSITKRKHDNDMIKRIGVILAEYNTKLLRPIYSVRITKTRQDNDVIDCISQLYAEKKLNYHDRSDEVQSMMKTEYDDMTIVQVWSMLKSKLHSFSRSNRMWSIIKSKQKNDTTYPIGMISKEYDAEL